MSLARSRSIALTGLEATVVEVEVWIGSGLPRTVVVGLPDAALKDAKERCRAAVASVGLAWPPHVVINLTPATLPKAGSHYDLAMTAAVLAADDVVPAARLGGAVMLGELGLDGKVRPVRGVLPALLAAGRQGVAHAVVPADQRAEAALVEGIEVHGVATLSDLIALLRGRPVTLPDVPEGAAASEAPPSQLDDLADVYGLAEARWTLEVAAAGRHHLYFHGPPGVGKTLLARRLPTILPELNVGEALEVAALHSLAGERVDGLVRRPPFADPHHTASAPSMAGGGSRVARPGAVSLAHRGVLFLDEAPEFSTKVLETLRTPLEAGEIVLSRSDAQVRYPARFQLVLAANPCPCGLAATPGSKCSCSPAAIRRYSSRLSGPILDRIDLHQHLLPQREALLRHAVPGESSAQVLERVVAARERQAARLKATPWATNSEVPGPYLRRQLPLPDGVGLVEDAVRVGRLSARGVDKVIKVAWTIADLAGAERPDADHVRVALALRQGEAPAVGRRPARSTPAPSRVPSPAPASSRVPAPSSNPASNRVPGPAPASSRAPAPNPGPALVPNPSSTRFNPCDEGERHAA